MARPSKYETNVKSRFKEIKKWVEEGASEKEIWTNLKIHKSTFYDYKAKHKEFSDLLKDNRTNVVAEIKAAMKKRALGFQYEEKKVITQAIVFDDGSGGIPAKVIRTETTVKTALPDVAAGLVLLQHWDKNKDGSVKWSRDLASKEIKEAELKLKEKKLEEENW